MFIPSVFLVLFSQACFLRVNMDECVQLEALMLFT